MNSVKSWSVSDTDGHKNPYLSLATVVRGLRLFVSSGASAALSIA